MLESKGKRQKAKGKTPKKILEPLSSRTIEPSLSDLCAERMGWIGTETAFDVLAKAKVRFLEIIESIKIIRECLKKMPDGPIEARIEEFPPGEGIGHAEAPRGEVFHYIRSDGTNRPLRHKVRAPSFMNIPSNVVAVKGGSIADAALTLAAVDPCYCCTERMAAFEDGRQKYTGKELLRLSWQKTEQLRARLAARPK